MKRTLVSLLWVGCSVMAWAAEDAPVDLKYRLSPNQSYAYRTTIKLNGEVKLPDAPEPEKVAAEVNIRQQIRVMKKDEKTGNWTLENRIRSDKPTPKEAPPPPQAPVILTMIDPNGKVLEVRGLEEMVKSNAIPGLDPTTFSNLLLIFPTFPKGQVKPGTSWSDEVPVQLPTGQRMPARRKLTLLALETQKDGSQVARIRTETTLSIDVKVAGTNGGTLTGSQSGKGESRILLSNGMPLESSTDVKMEIIARPTKPPVDDKGKPVDGAVQVVTQMVVEAKQVPDSPTAESAAPTEAAKTDAPKPNTP